MNKEEISLVRVPSLWNSLPQSTRQQTSVSGFKAAYDGTTLRQPGLPCHPEDLSMKATQDEQPCLFVYFCYVIIMILAQSALRFFFFLRPAIGHGHLGHT